MLLLLELLGSACLGAAAAVASGWAWWGELEIALLLASVGASAGVALALAVLEQPRPAVCRFGRTPGKESSSP
jgi:hypothetical protein